MPALDLRLFGMPRVARDDAEVTFARRKAVALLAYLAVTRQPHGRDALATLFWPDQDQTRARAGLRRVLVDLHQTLGQEWLLTAGDQVALADAAELRVDVLRFRSLLAQAAAHNHPQFRICDGCLAALNEAAALYRDHFLAGFTLHDTAEFDDWQAYESDGLARELAAALEKLATGLAARGQHEAALVHGRRWLALDPLDETAQRAVMRLYAWAGDRAVALGQYQACVKTLAEELGVEPEPETVALHDALVRGGSGAGDTAGLLPPSAAPHNLPPDPTPFVGREHELVQIAGLLAESACRLLTVVGPGGVGKTRLAIQAARGQVERFDHGVYLVELAAVNAAGLLAPAILRGLDVPQGGATRQAEQQLLAYLRDKQMLLLLDNFEQLLGGVGLLAQLLRAAPRVKLLVTSRVRLNLREEWLAPLEGLQVPPDGDGRGVPGRRAEPMDLENYSASTLFVGCVRRLRLDWQPGRDDARHIVQVCRLLDGLPLGIELAAGWVRTLPVAAIAAELAHGLGFLQTSLADVPERHRSMTTVFDYSWRLLTPREQSCLRQMAVFRGGFTQGAAQVVAGATLGDLARLADASWLRVDASGRYLVHELIRQYCGEKLAAEHLVATGESADRVYDRHAAYYRSRMLERPAGFFWTKAARQELAADYANLLTAWQRYLQVGDLETIRVMAVVFAWLAYRQGWYHEVGQLLDAGVRVLRQDEAAARDAPERQAERSLVIAALLVWLARVATMTDLSRAEACLQESEASISAAGALSGEGEGGGRGDWRWAETRWFQRRVSAWVRYYRGHYEESARSFRALLSEVQAGGLKLWPYTDDAPWAWQTEICEGWGWSVLRLGRYEEARRLAEQCIVFRERRSQEPDTMLGQHLLHQVAIATGDDQQAEERARKMLDWARTGEVPGLALDVLPYMGQAQVALGRYDRARAYYRRHLALARQLGSSAYAALAMYELGDVALAQGRPAEARRLFEESQASFNWSGNISNFSLAALQVGLGRVALAEHDVAGTKACFRQALAMANHDAWPMAGAITYMGYALAEEGELARAVELLAAAEAWSGAPYGLKQVAGQGLRDLEARLPADAFASAAARGRARQIEELAAELIGGSGSG
ncbi:MAG: BTAD domain-containing putative transcriptional regulator [Chloroflexi bacterium]|nr:BTAD domain-containing putative transcriptional regulator [Chloroflexota bacterium]